LAKVAGKHYDHISAFTVAELGEILKPHLNKVKDMPDEFTRRSMVFTGCFRRIIGEGTLLLD